MDKKKIILISVTIFLFIVVIFLSYLLLNKFILKKNFEQDILPFAKKNENTIFSIKKILLFSSADAKWKNSSASNFTIENLYQYTDMAIFISNSSSEKNLENTFKKVSINNINISSPLLGEPKLYFKSINNFAKSDIIEDNQITDHLDFNISSQDEADLSTPTLYNNLANPITLSYINQNIKSDYTITDTTSPITYDGSLLKKCSILLNSLTCNISFDIYITNNKDEEFKCSIYLDIPLEIQGKSIYDGNITYTKDTNFIFYRYK